MLNSAASGSWKDKEDTVVVRRIAGLIGWSVLALPLVTAGACNREPAPENSRAAQTAEAPSENAGRQDDHSADIARLNARVADIEKKYTEKNQQVATGRRTATAGLREEVKEVVANVKEAVRDLGTTTPENWWDRHEHAMARTADDIEADVRRIAGARSVNAAPRPAGTAGTENSAAAPFTSRRDAFVASLQARVDALKQALQNVKASGPRETELSDTRARLDKLDDDIDKLRSASAGDWWDVSKARVTEYVDRVEASVDRLDDDKPSR
jgi:hypothetical protein